MAEPVEQFHVLRVQNGWSVISLRPAGRNMFGHQQYEEVVNIFHCLREVANFLGNYEKQEELRKD